MLKTYFLFVNLPYLSTKNNIFEHVLNIILISMDKNKSQIKFPWFYYSLFMMICFIGRLLFNGSASKSDAFKKAKNSGPMLVVCNHASSFDFMFFSPPFFGKKIAFVVAENMLYSTPFLAKIIRKAKEITKKQYVADIQCVRKIKKYLDAGISVALCPEGQVSSSGKTGVITMATAKLIKFLGYPVAVCRTLGAGLSRPKWSYTARRGKVSTECDILFSENEVKDLDINQIYTGLVKALEFNEHTYQLENDIKFKGRRYAEGIEKLLYQCPKCGKKYTMESKGKIIKCRYCGNAVEYTKRGQLVGLDDNSYTLKRVDLWYEWQRENMRKKLLDKDFMLSGEVILFIEKPESASYKYIAKGKLILDKENISFCSGEELRPANIKSKYGIGTFDISVKNGKMEAVEEEFKKFSISIRNNESCAFNPGVSLEFYDAKHSYRFVFTKEKMATEYALAIEELYKSRTCKHTI